jgi:threonine dehydrogenase-like Zn-dependent dehydrogenase
MNVFSQIADSFMGQRATEVPHKPVMSSTKTMHALVWNGANDVQYKVTAAPMITDPRDVIVRVTATTICGSDIHLVDGSMPNMYQGDVLGHEFMGKSFVDDSGTQFIFLGIVEEVGPEVRTIQTGQRVVVAFDIACGECSFCMRKEFSSCKMTNPSNLIAAMYGHRTSAIYGYSHLTGGIPGGQAELVRVPIADVNCLAVPDEIPDEKALFLTDVLPTSYHGVKLANIQKGDVVGIWGMVRNFVFSPFMASCNLFRKLFFAPFSRFS